MSITVRLWSKQELEAVKTDKWLATLLLNETTHTLETILAYQSIPKKNHKVYLCEWVDEGGEAEPVKVKATDEKMLANFLDNEYIRRPDFISQIITQYKPVHLS